MVPESSPHRVEAEKIKKLSELTEKDILILIMGSTGSGKSHFLDILIDQPFKYANSGLNSSPSVVNVIRIKGHPVYGDNLVLVDTPGFDDTNKSDREILGVTSEWLAKTYKMNVKLSAVIYLQRVTDNRMSEALYRGFYVFSELCGFISRDHVALVTTMWDLVDAQAGEETEKVLRERLWPIMADPDHGVFTVRLANTKKSAWSIVENLLGKFPQGEKVDLLIQKEMCGGGGGKKAFKQTAAFQALYASMEIILNFGQSEQRHVRGKATADEILADFRSAQSKINGILGNFIPSPENDVVIPVMGPTGAGKSTFINEILKGAYTEALDPEALMRVGYSLRSCTKEVQVAVLPHTSQGPRIVLVDTPGFDDTYEEDRSILERIANWLKASYEDPNAVLGGVIYLHDISQDRFAGTALRSLSIFKALCGISVVDKIILGTTKWAKIGENVGTDHENELCKTHWKSLVEKGARVRQYKNTYDSARVFIDDTLDRLTFNTVLEIQTELAVQKKKIPQTKAGQEYIHHQILEIKHQLMVSDNTETIERLRKAEQRFLKELQLKDVPTTLSMRIRRILRF